MVLKVLNIKTALEWVYHDQKVEAVYPKRRGGGLKVKSTSVRTLAALTEAAGELGAIVRSGSIPEAQVDDDAEYIHAVVCLLDKPIALMMMDYARRLDAPWWAPEGYRRQQAVVKNGKQVMVYDSNRHPIGPKMETVGYDPLDVDAARAEYALWFDALIALQEYFKDQARPLVTVALKPLAIDPEPWTEKKCLQVRN